jgi:tetratricopeptide (TPR) repeat protein
MKGFIMFCPHCGINIILKDQVFCHHCGYDLSKIVSNQSDKSPNETDRLKKGTLNYKVPSVSGKDADAAEYSRDKSAIESSNKQERISPKIKQVHNVHIEQVKNKRWKYGYGWAILLYLFYSPQISKGYEALGTTGLAIQFFGAIVSISIYFILRQIILVTKIENKLIRSLTSGIISYGIIWLTIFMLGKTILSPNISQYNDSKQMQSSMEEKDKAFAQSVEKKSRNGNFYGALEDCNAAIRNNPNSDLAYSTRGAIKIILNDSVGAMEDINKAIDLNPNSSESYRVRSTLRSKNDKQGALSDISKAIELAHTSNATSLVARGYIELELGDNEAARRDFIKSIDIYSAEILKDSTSAASFHGRALSKYLLGDIQGACADLRMANKLGFVQAADEIKRICE